MPTRKKISSKRASVKPTKPSKQEFLRGALIGVEGQFLESLRHTRARSTHSGAMGSAVENLWIEWLERSLPTRYRVARAFAIDHRGGVSEQLDCIIYDAHFTPRLFGDGDNLYIPAEAVYATFEVKQTVNAEHLEYARKKAASIRRLKRTSAPIPYNAGGTAPNKINVNQPKTPAPLICGLLAMGVEWKTGFGEAFLRNLKNEGKHERLDLILTAEGGFCDRLDMKSRRPKIVTGDGAMIRGLFRLLTALRDKATVSAVEWEKYERCLESSEEKARAKAK